MLPVNGPSRFSESSWAFFEASPIAVIINLQCLDIFSIDHLRRELDCLDFAVAVHGDGHIAAGRSLNKLIGQLFLAIRN